MKEISSVTIPAKPGYLVAIRLFASALASQQGLDIDTVEEIKLCTAEACMLLMNQPSSAGALGVEFRLDGGSMEVDVEALGPCVAIQPADTEDSGLGKDILEALADSLEIGSENGAYKRVSFSKNIPER